MSEEQKIEERIKEVVYHPSDYVIDDFSISALSNGLILKHSAELISTDSRGYFDIYFQTIEVNTGEFAVSSGNSTFILVGVKQHENSLILSCGCKTPKKKLCEHQIQVLYNIMNRQEIRVFFDATLRHEKIKQVAVDYGLENESNLDDFFQLEYANKAIEIKPKLKELIPFNRQNSDYLKEHLLPIQGLSFLQTPAQKATSKMIVVFRQHKYYDHFNIELYEAQASQDGKIKNPLTAVNPLDYIWKTEDSEVLKFYSAIAKFQNNYDSSKSESAIQGLKALVKNPLGLAIFYHTPQISSNITSSSVTRVQLKPLDIDIRLSVDIKENFYEVAGQLMLDEKSYELKHLKVKYDYFLLMQETMYLIDNVDFLRVINFFKDKNNKILIHQSKYGEFQFDILSKLENKIRITYSYLKPATKEQIQENGFDDAIEQIIYLSDLEHYVLLTPVVKYGNVEIPVLSKKQIYSLDRRGRAFTVERDEALEIEFTSMLIRQHPDFYEQLDKDCFYLPKVDFLDGGWFLEAFEEWNRKGITVLGFNTLKDNRLNPNKAKISVSVASGIDWFDTTVKVQYGKQQVSLKHLHKSIRNRSKFVQLGDGTMGILPEEWIEKFSQYFHAGEVIGEHIRVPKINFSGIAEMFEAEVLSTEVKSQLALYQSKLSKFESIETVEVPEGLQTTLREYQKQGLNWLNFLDEFGFGGCLADDMGLGKTVQVIAFILSQRAKGHQNTNLIVVPTSLIFNWQAEVEKFAPSIKIHTIYGSDRIKDAKVFDAYEIILTSYGTLLSDIRFLKEYRFNYIFLDESQAIKNPESQRYKAVRLLQSRNKVVLTGTPIENNTFDLYGQLSFACAGLLGNKQYFKDHYSTPIDRFKDSKRAVELQKKVSPFILRRTKKQVATELPDNTEMVIYCEMGAEQRKVYDAYEKEFKNFLLTKQEGDIPRESLHVLQGLTKLRQICDSPALLSNDEFYGEASAKIEVLMEQIENKSPQHKILVFSQFVTMLDLIRKELITRNISFEYLTGQTKNRGDRVEEFQNNEEVRVFLISLKAGGAGLNLTEADYVYLVDPWWNPAVENQAIDRCYRIGQKKNVVAVRLICPDTIEEKIMDLQASKKGLAGDLVKTDSAVLKSLTKADLMGLFK